MSNIETKKLKLIIWVVVLIWLSILTINRFAPPLLNADTILFSIMLIQKVTLFIWGQDRLANFIPFFLSIIHDPYYNLFAHLMIFCLSYFSLALLVSFFIMNLKQDAISSSDILLVFMIFIFVSFFAFTDHATYLFFIEGQPYALSYLLLFLSFYLYLKAVENNNPTSLAACIPLNLIATGLNPSIILPSAALAIGATIIKRRLSYFVFFLFSLVVFFLWIKLSAWFGTPTGAVKYSVFDYKNCYNNALLAFSQIAVSVRFSWLIVLWIIVSAISLFTNKNETDKKIKTVSLLVIIFSVSWFLIFSQNEWVKINNSHYRYFFPVHLTLILLPTIITSNLALQLPVSVRKWIIWSLFIAINIFLVRPPILLNEYNIFERINPYFSSAIKNNVKFFAGYYWDVWPIVFQLSRKKSSFGLVYRGVGNKSVAMENINHELREYGKFKVLCISSSNDECLKQIRDLTNKNWKYIAEDCGKSCSLLTLYLMAPFQVSGFDLISYNGLSAPESWGAWSDSKKVVFEMASDLPKAFKLHLKANAFGPNVSQHFCLHVGLQEKFFTLASSPQEISLILKNIESVRTIIIDVPSPTSPKDLGLSSDDRKLGIAISELRIEPVNN